MGSLPHKPIALESVDIPKWSSQLDGLARRYAQAAPFPHIVLDGFLRAQVAQHGLKQFPDISSDKWIHYLHYNEKKHGLNKLDALPSTLRKIISDLNSEHFVRFLTELTGISGLRPDPALEGGGLHQSRKGGFLNVHTDFTAHPHHANWHRRVNVLVYLNDNWQEQYNGHLELWNPDMSECVQKVSPIFNRCVVFTTDEGSYHGHPIPLDCPEDVTRKSIALYYFTVGTADGAGRATHYKARPEDKARRLLIRLDNTALTIYSKLKRRFGFDDGVVSNLLSAFKKDKKK